VEPKGKLTCPDYESPYFKDLLKDGYMAGIDGHDEEDPACVLQFTDKGWELFERELALRALE
jgi:hypothetical protein